MKGLSLTRLLTAVCCTPGLLLLFALNLSTANTAHAQDLSCPVSQQISERFDNGAGWDMCWEARQRENIVLSDISYTPAGGTPISVLAALRMAQLHVAYDDSNVTYNDVTQFGLGAAFRSTLVAENCPGGQLIDIEGRAGMCRQRSKGDDAYRTPNEAILSESLTLFSVSQVGSYAYIVTWKFFADGTIAPSVGATGALQRSSDFAASPFGRELEGVTDKSWLSHTHNYYWQMDFDLGASATDDVVSEISYPVDRDGRRARTETMINVESARKVEPENLVSWKVSDNGSGAPGTPAYLIEPLHYGHRLVRSEMEPFTDFDFFVTKQSDCEDFVSENAKYNPDCSENILQFVNDEPLQDQDITLWHRVSFHHVPRNEDRKSMHSHWDGFSMRASNMNSLTPGHSGIVRNIPPVIASPGNQSGVVGQSVELVVISSDADADAIQIDASGLPAGLSINDNGIITGTLNQTGTFQVAVVVSDSQDSVSTNFDWQVTDGSGNNNASLADGGAPNNGSSGNSSGGSGGSLWMVLAMLLMFGVTASFKRKS